jgi:hypothetical protein
METIDWQDFPVKGGDIIPPPKPPPWRLADSASEGTSDGT